MSGFACREGGARVRAGRIRDFVVEKGKQRGGDGGLQGGQGSAVEERLPWS